MNTNDYLDAIKQRFLLTSDYQIAKKIGISPQRVSKYRNGHDYFGEEVAVTAAELLEIDPGQILADIAAERTKCPAAKAAWQRAARMLSGVAASIFIGVLTILTTPPAMAETALNIAQVYILC